MLFQEILNRISQLNILVVGDVMVDRYLNGTATRLCPEAPVPVLKIESVTMAPGGAANLAVNVKSLGAHASLLGVTGNDRYGRWLFRRLRAQGITFPEIRSRGRPTTIKTRIVAGQQMLLRIDRELPEPISPAQEAEILQKTAKLLPSAAVVVISDYAKGVVTASLAARLAALCRREKKKLIVDPKGPDYTKYSGANILTPNLREAEMAAGIEINGEDSLRRAGEILLAKTACEAVVITRGEKGATLIQPGAKVWNLPAVASAVFDVAGAGDTLVAALALALAAGCSLQEALAFGNLAAGVAVRKKGTSTVTAREIFDLLKTTPVPDYPFRHF